MVSCSQFFIRIHCIPFNCTVCFSIVQCSIVRGMHFVARSTSFTHSKCKNELVLFRGADNRPKMNYKSGENGGDLVVCMNRVIIETKRHTLTRTGDGGHMTRACDDSVSIVSVYNRSANHIPHIYQGSSRFAHVFFARFFVKLN